QKRNIVSQKTYRVFELGLLVVALHVVSASGQLPILTQGQRGQRGAAQPTAPAGPTVVSPLAAASPEVTSPGPFNETLMELKPTDDLAHFGHVTKEYFVSGIANNQPHKTRIVIRNPADNAKFSGLILAESMHRAETRGCSISRTCTR